MKKIILLMVIYINFLTLAQSGNGHDPNTLLSYTPSGYTVPTYMRQASTSTNTADNTISAGDRTDLYVNFTYDTYGKNVFLVYATNGTAPTKTNGSVVNGTFSNYSDPNRTWLASVPTTANTQGTTINYIFYISDSDLASAWGRVAADGYKTTWTEGDSYFQYTVEAPLPVKLLSFTASLFDTEVFLKWSTATEIDNYGFNVECKMNNEEWKNIGFVQGNGNSNSPKNYSFIHENASAGKLKYRLKQIDYDGKFEYSKEIEVINDTQLKFLLEQNYPNPFNPETVIKYNIPKESYVKLSIFDILGQEVAILINELQNAGTYNYLFSIKNYQLPSGIYFYKLKAGNNIDIKKMILTK